MFTTGSGCGSEEFLLQGSHAHRTFEDMTGTTDSEGLDLSALQYSANVPSDLVQSRAAARVHVDEGDSYSRTCDWQGAIDAYTKGLELYPVTAPDPENPDDDGGANS